MTRENKLALVVGFGLVLFVGILISDHYSEARRAESANLNERSGMDRSSRYVVDRLTEVRRREASSAQARPFMASTNGLPQGAPDHTDLDGRTPADNRGLNGALAGADESVIIDDPMVRRAQGEVEYLTFTLPEQPVKRDPASSGSSATPRGRTYQVRSGETLYAIALREYGDGNAWKALAEYNKLQNAERLREGARLVLPDPSALGLRSGSSSAPGAGDRPGDTARADSTPSGRSAANGGASANGRSSGAGDRPGRGNGAESARVASTKTYTVQDGDTLAKIASKVLGSRGRWPEIHALNRDRLADPDRVVPGMVIRVPAFGS